ncbi:hypothetical protein B0H13DRAFT_653303 [Mycena leptocephala]|nr:hypothetical protein B0H13DRAFT_653303 [Mycena leptocephala]
MAMRSTPRRPRPAAASTRRVCLRARGATLWLPDATSQDDKLKTPHHDTPPPVLIAAPAHNPLIHAAAPPSSAAVPSTRNRRRSPFACCHFPSPRPHSATTLRFTYLKTKPHLTLSAEADSKTKRLPAHFSPDSFLHLLHPSYPPSSMVCPSPFSALTP